MRNQCVLALVIVLALGQAAAKKNNPDNSHPSPEKSERVEVYSDAPGVITPALLPLNLPLMPIEECQQKVDGKALLSVIVDSAGEPRDLWFLRAMGNDIDKLALQVASEDRFTPGTIHVSPVAVAQTLEVSIQACLIETKDSSGATSHHLELRSQPTQDLVAPFQPLKEVVLTAGDSWSDSKNRPPRTEQVGGSVTAPIALISPRPQLTDEARRAKYQGACMLQLIVDRNGMPQAVKLVRKLDYGLDLKAVEAVEKSRFKPAMKNGEPVPVMITVKISISLYPQ
jgi:TonB family protein